MSVVSNTTIVNKPGEEERLFWTVFHVIIALLSLSGDTIILVATIRYKAIKLHCVIVVIIQHLALCDLLQTLFRVIPTIISLEAGEWVLGVFLCHMTLNMVIVCIPAAAVLTAVLSTSKLLIVQYPLRAGTWTRRRGHTVCTLSWVFCLVRPRLWENVMFTDTDSASLDYILYPCQGEFTTIPVWFIWFQEIFIYLAFVGVLLTLITTSVMLLYKARQAAVRVRTSVRWRGTLTVLLTTLVFLVSYLPDCVVPFLDSNTLTATIHRAATFSVTFNIAANFFVYSLTVASFREFLSRKIRLLAGKVGLFTSPPAVAVCQKTHITEAG